MLTSGLRRSCAGLLALAICATASIAEDLPKAHAVLFGSPHIASLPPGTALVYKFERSPSDQKLLGEAFSDNITVTIDGEADPGKKNITVQVYSGNRAREPQRIGNMEGNPMLVVYLDNAVSHFRQLAGGDSAYLKGTFSRYLQERATIAPVTITYKGAAVPGYRVTATPYADDPAKGKMNGYEGATFTIALSDKIPGHFAKMISTFKSTDQSAPSLEETTTLDGVGDVK